MSTRTSKYLSAAALGRRLNLPPPRLAALLKTGALKPDAVAGRARLFNPQRLAAIRAELGLSNRPFLG